MPQADRTNSTTDQIPPATFVQVLIATWRYALQPKRAAFVFVRGHAVHIALSFAFSILVLAGSACFHFVLFDATTRQTGIGLFGSKFTNDGRGLLQADPLHSLRDSYADPRIRHHVTVLFWVLPTLTSGLALFSSWLLLPMAYVGGSCGKAFLRTFRTVMSGAGFLVLLFNAVAATFHVIHANPIGASPLGVLIALLALSAVLVWLTQGIRSLRNLPYQEPVSLVCEGCGYDLTYQSPTGLCTECGLSIEQSVVPDRKRTRLCWSRSDGLSIWVGQSFSTVCTGAHVYRNLKLQQSTDDLSRFARTHYLSIFGGAMIWAFSCLLVFQLVLENQGMPEWRDLTLVALAVSTMACLVTLAGWLVHRAVGAIVATWWFSKGMFRVPTFAENVICCEAPFLWFFCFFNGTMITSFWLFDDWITQTFGWQFWNVLLGIPSEPAVILAGNAALIIWWMVRMHRAFLAVRWANF